MKKRIGIMLMSVMMALSLAACGTSKSDSRMGSASASYNTTAPTETYSSDYVGGKYEEASTEAASEDMYDGGMDTSGGSGIDLTATAAEEQKLVYTCNMTLETLRYSDTMKAVRDLIAQYNGVIESEDTSNNDYQWYVKDSEGGTWSTYLTIRVPADSYNDFLTGLEGTDVNVRNKSQSVENITGSYSDQSVLVEALETQEQRLLEMMQQAETVEDMIAVEQRLTEVQTELNQAKAVLKGYDLDVNYSTVNLNVIEVRDYSVDVQEKSFGERLAMAFTESWKDFGHFLQRLLESLVYMLPFLILLAVVIFAVVKIVKKVCGKNPRPKKEKRFGKKRKKGEIPEAADVLKGDTVSEVDEVAKETAVSETKVGK